MRKTKTEILAGLEGVTKSKLIANNTIELQYNNGNNAIRLHLTDIVTKTPEGKIILNSGGWRTVTTKDRLNRYSPFEIYSVKGQWQVKTNKGEYTFYDGITFDNEGRLLTENKTIDFSAINKIKKSIRGYVKLIDKLDKIPYPDNGDCWYCLFEDKETGKSLGDLTPSEHLQSHIKEKYIFGAIIFSALQEAGYVNPETIIYLGVKESIKRALTRYLQKRLIKEQDIIK